MDEHIVKCTDEIVELIRPYVYRFVYMTQHAGEEYGNTPLLSTKEYIQNALCLGVLLLTAFGVFFFLCGMKRTYIEKVTKRFILCFFTNKKWKYFFLDVLPKGKYRVRRTKTLATRIYRNLFS